MGFISPEANHSETHYDSDSAFQCGNYRSKSGECVSHYVKTSVLEAAILQAIQAVSIGISALSAMFAGFLSAKLCHSKGLIMGLFSGLILFACVLISAFSTGGNVFTVSTAMRFLLMMIGGAFGGVLAVNKRKKVK